MAIRSFMVPLGSLAPDFTLPRADDGGVVRLADSAGAPALLVAFLCNHCPYVQYVESSFGAFAEEYAQRGLATVGICANDVASYPDDDRPHLVAQAKRAGFGFPYLVDEVSTPLQPWLWHKFRDRLWSISTVRRGSACAGGRASRGHTSAV